MKIKLKVGEQVLTATLLDNDTARDFASLLPLSVTMDDLFKKEKYASLPRAISTKGKRAFTYEVGDIGYWSPSSDLAIYYKTDGEKIPSPGIIIIGKLDSTARPFDVPGSVKVTIERATK
jgi:hypothetical protein